MAMYIVKIVNTNSKRRREGNEGTEKHERQQITDYDNNDNIHCHLHAFKNYLTSQVFPLVWRKELARSYSLADRIGARFLTRFG